MVPVFKITVELVKINMSIFKHMLWEFREGKCPLILVIGNFHGLLVFFLQSKALLNVMLKHPLNYLPSCLRAYFKIFLMQNCIYLEQTVSYCLYDSINTVNISVGHPLKILINNHYTTKQQASEGTSVWLFSLFLEVFLFHTNTWK